MPNPRPVGSVLEQVSASLGSVQLGVVHPSGVNVYLSSIAGWWDPPASSGTANQKSADHGAFLTPAYYGPRIIDLILRPVGWSWDSVTPVLEEILAAVPIDGLTAFTESGRTAAVRQNGDPIVTRVGAAAQVAISLLAPDARKYAVSPTVASTGLPTTTGGLVLPVTLPVTIGATTATGLIQVSNDGRAETLPVFTIAGPCPPSRISHLNSGRVVTIPGAVPAGRTLTIDMANQVGLLDGTEPRAVAGPRIVYTPGLNTVAFTASSYDPAALLTSTHRSAWI